MTFKWFFMLLTSMVHTRPTNKLKRSKRTQKQGEVDEIKTSSSETDSVDWDQLEIENEPSKTAATDKGKAAASSTAKTPLTAAEKGKAPMATPPSRKRKGIAKKKGKRGGIVIEEPQLSLQTQDTHAGTDRIRDFENRECIGERHVNLGALRSRSADFGRIMDVANLSPICTFPERTGYCLHLVRTFYTNARQLQETENGPMDFITTVRGTQLKITPRLIGEVIGMRPSLSGPHYLKGKTMTDAAWRTVIREICVPDTPTSGISVYSKELIPEYKFLNFIICYNIQPNMNTKVLRWDRMFLLYLLGNPTEGAGLNFNIPYLIWSKMAQFVENPQVPKRLPFPLIIMRILRKFKVDTSSTSYQYSLGTINDSTVVKSLPRTPDDTPTPPRGRMPSNSTPPKSRTKHTTSGPSSQLPTSDDEASVTSIYREQQRLSSEQERISKSQARIYEELQILTASQVTITKKFDSLKKLMKNMFSQMGCKVSDDESSED